MTDDIAPATPIRPRLARIIAIRKAMLPHRATLLLQRRPRHGTTGVKLRHFLRNAKAPQA